MTAQSLRIGRYEVFPPFAVGGVATVHVGRLIGPGGFSKLVAVKRQRAEASTRDGDPRIFTEEARLAARIRSPFVVPIIELLSEHDELSIVMELVHGVSLSALAAGAKAKGTWLPQEVVSTILSDVRRM